MSLAAEIIIIFCTFCTLFTLRWFKRKGWPSLWPTVRQKPYLKSIFFYNAVASICVSIAILITVIVSIHVLLDTIFFCDLWAGGLTKENRPSLVVGIFAWFIIVQSVHVICYFVLRISTRDFYSITLKEELTKGFMEYPQSERDSLKNAIREIEKTGRTLRKKQKYHKLCLQKKAKEEIDAVVAAAQQLTMQSPRSFCACFRQRGALRKLLVKRLPKLSDQLVGDFEVLRGFPDFTESVLRELGVDLINGDCDGSEITTSNLDNERARAVTSISFATATALLWSFQVEKPEYNKENPNQWQKKFTQPLLKFLQNAAPSLQLSWIQLFTESMRNKIGIAPTLSADEWEKYRKDINIFFNHIYVIIKERFQHCEVASLPMILCLIDKGDEKHTFIGLDKPSGDRLVSRLEPAQQQAKSVEYAANWPFIHSTNVDVYSFFQGIYSNLYYDDGRHAEAIRDMLRYCKQSGLEMLLQSPYEQGIHGPINLSDSQPKHVVFTRKSTSGAGGGVSQ